MSNIVAISALGEASQHTRRVRRTVAALAGWHRLVLVFVTGNTVDTLMFCIGFAVQFERFLVTRCAHLVGGVGRIRNSSRHMGLVTTLAISCGHIGAMRLVALGTKRNLAMRIMAEAASQSGVLAFDLLQLNDLLSMAGETLVSDIVRQFNDFWSMRIVVAADTSGKIVVRFTAVTLTAKRDDFFDGRRMAGMTILATNLRFVGSSIGSNSFRCCRMTLDTISVPKRRLWISSSGRQHHHPHQQCR